MLFVPTLEGRFDALGEAVRSAEKVDAALVSRILAEAGTRITMLRRAGKAAHIDRLIAAQAWRELAFALVEDELPAWTLRRLVHEDGEWHCALSRQPNLPLEVDDVAEASHASLSIAILCALIEARRKVEDTRQAARAPVPALRIGGQQVVCCDNFS